MLIALGIGGVIFALIEGQTYGWVTPKRPFSIGNWTWPSETISISLVSMIVGLIALAVFVWWELRLQRKGKEPLFDFTLTRFPSFRYGLITVAIVALGEFGVIFVLSLFLQGVQGLTAFQVGLIFLPFAIATLITAPSAGLLSNRFGAKWVVTIGMLIEAGGSANEGQVSLEGAPAGFETTAAGKAIGQVIQQSFVDGARNAALVASIFVLLGAFSSLLIPNNKMQGMREVAAAH